MLKIKHYKLSYNHALRIASGLVVGIILFGMTSGLKIAKAQTLQERIDNLKKQNAQNRSTVDKLQEVATSYEDAIDQLKHDIEDKEKEISLSQKKQAEIESEIKQAEAELQKQKNLLGENIRAMYVEGDISTIEMLASSKDLSEFIDKEQYRNSVKDKITETLAQIQKLKESLRKQKAQVAKEIQSQKERRAELAANRVEQSRLLSLNESQQADYNKKTKKNQQKIKELEAAQEALSRRISSGNFVSQGSVNRGDILGTVGNTGFSFGAHLHLEARNSGGSVIDPNQFLGSGAWMRPVEGGYVSQGYGAANPIYVRGWHPGIDYAGVTNRPVMAVADGEIVSRGWSTFGTSAYGYAVVIRHSNGVYSIYGHMNPP